MEQVKARPILFNGDMVRALLDGRKTMTRQVIKPQPRPGRHADGRIIGKAANRHLGDIYHIWEPREGRVIPLTHNCAYRWRPMCPYGVPGDLLWVRECFGHVGTLDPGYLVYRATYPEFLPDCVENIPDEPPRGTWKPSIHMPRTASRLTLRVTDVRVERVQDISEADAKAEGAQNRKVLRDPTVNPFRMSIERLAQHEFVNAGFRSGFRERWDSINDKRGFGWDANPWVWVVSFEVIRANVDQVLQERTP